MKWLDVLVEALAGLCAFSGALGALVTFALFHLGVRDFQDYESEP
jgi:hypothetical protein